MLLASVFMDRVTSAVEVTYSMCYGCRDVTVRHVKYLSLLELLRVHVLLLPPTSFYGKNMVPSWSFKMSTCLHLQTFPFIPAASCTPASPVYCNSSSYPPGSGLMPQSVTWLGSQGQMISSAVRWTWGFFVVWTGSLGEDETEVSVNEPELWLLNDPRALQRNTACWFFSYLPEGFVPAQWTQNRHV